MGRLLRFEFRKLKSQKVFFISLAIIVVYTLLGAIGEKLALEWAMRFEEEEYMALSTISTSNMIMSAVSGGLLTLLCSIAVPIIVVEDFEQGIVKNVYAKGYRRESVFFAKLIYALACVTALFVAQILSSTLFYGIVFGFEWVGWKGFGLLWAQYLAFLATFAFFFAVSATYKKVGAAIPINIFFPSIVGVLLGVISFVLAKENFNLANYWFSSFLDDLSYFEIEGKRILECIIASVMYIGAFITGAFFINRSTEV
ncbi:MAG: ABC transporter permease [Clostridia bacterium]|nr:ABC transporter permease [Clostridia bacterium]